MSTKDTATAAIGLTPSSEAVDPVLVADNAGLLQNLGLAPLTSGGAHGVDSWALARVPQEFTANPFYTMVGVPVVSPKKERVTKWMRFMGKTASGRRGCVLVVMIDDYIVTVEQFRLPILLATGKLEEARTTELPRYHATTELVQTLHDRALRQKMAGKIGQIDATVVEDARTLLGSELQALLLHASTVEAVVHLGSFIEWDESMVPIEIVLVRLAHPDIESLREKDLGPPHMKIRLYPFSQLLVSTERDKLNLRDEHSIAGLALAWGWCQCQNKTIQKLRAVEYQPAPFQPIGTKGRELAALNQRLSARGHRLLNVRGAMAPGGEIESLNQNPWFADEDADWEILRARNRLPNGIVGDYFIRFLAHSASVSRDTLIGIINGTQLLSVVSHHLPCLAFKKDADRRAWCARPPWIMRNTRGKANAFSRLLHDNADMQLPGPGEQLVLELMRRAKVSAGTNHLRYEDTGTCAVQGHARVAHITTAQHEQVQMYQPDTTMTGIQLIGLPIAAALTHPSRYNLADIRTLSALLTAAETIGLL